MGHTQMLQDAIAKIFELEQQLQQAHRHATEEVAQAHKRGWEQCQKESVYIATKYLTNSVGEKIADAIASMEYKERGEGWTK